MLHWRTFLFCSPLVFSVVLTTHSRSAPCTKKRFSFITASIARFYSSISSYSFMHTFCTMLSNSFSFCRRPCCSSIALQYVSSAAVPLLINMCFVAAVCSLFIVSSSSSTLQLLNFLEMFPTSFFLLDSVPSLYAGRSLGALSSFCSCLSSLSEPHLSFVCAASSHIHPMTSLKKKIIAQYLACDQVVQCFF